MKLDRLTSTTQHLSQNAREHARHVAAESIAQVGAKALRGIASVVCNRKSPSSINGRSARLPVPGKSRRQRTRSRFSL